MLNERILFYLNNFIITKNLIWLVGLKSYREIICEKALLVRIDFQNDIIWSKLHTLLYRIWLFTERTNKIIKKVTWSPFYRKKSKKEVYKSSWRSRLGNRILARADLTNCTCCKLLRKSHRIGTTFARLPNGCRLSGKYTKFENSCSCRLITILAKTLSLRPVASAYCLIKRQFHKAIS